MKCSEVLSELVRYAGEEGRKWAENRDFSVEMDQLCTRGEMVRFLYDFHGLDTLNIKPNPYVDVSEDLPCFNAVLWAADLDLIAKGEPFFRPMEPCRQEEAAVLFRTYFDRMKRAE